MPLLRLLVLGRPVHFQWSAAGLHLPRPVDGENARRIPHRRPRRARGTAPAARRYRPGPDHRLAARAPPRAQIRRHRRARHLEQRSDLGLQHSPRRKTPSAVDSLTKRARRPTGRHRHASGRQPLAPSPEILRHGIGARPARMLALPDPAASVINTRRTGLARRPLVDPRRIPCLPDPVLHHELDPLARPSAVRDPPLGGPPPRLRRAAARPNTHRLVRAQHRRTRRLLERIRRLPPCSRSHKAYVRASGGEERCSGHAVGDLEWRRPWLGVAPAGG
jgi:hypothetical protein